jgi:hypothetical protein
MAPAMETDVILIDDDDDDDADGDAGGDKGYDALDKIVFNYWC